MMVSPLCHCNGDDCDDCGYTGVTQHMAPRRLTPAQLIAAEYRGGWQFKSYTRQAVCDAFAASHQIPTPATIERLVELIVAVADEVAISAI